MRSVLIDREMQAKRKDPPLHANRSEIRDPDFLDRPLDELEAVIALTRHAGRISEWTPTRQALNILFPRWRLHGIPTAVYDSTRHPRSRSTSVRGQCSLPTFQKVEDSGSRR